MIDRSLLLFAKLLLAWVTLSWSSTEAAIIYSGIYDATLDHNSNASLSIIMGEVTDSFRIMDERGGFRMRDNEFPTSYSSVYDERLTDVIAFDRDAGIDHELSWSLMGPRSLVRYDDTTITDPGEFFDQTDKFIAIRILDDTDTFFGWIRTSHSVEDEQLTVHDWAWNDVSGEPILAGQVPEPAAVALLAGISVLGVALLLRRRNGPIRQDD